MAYRRDSFAANEWYHCFSRGVDRRTVFTSERDYERFLEALYLSNDEEPTARSNFQYIPHADVFKLKRGDPIVSIAAYCLMPNHFHILIQELQDGGITKFMRKLGTSYTMYFNTKYERVGNLFIKPFRSKRIDNDAYFMHIPQYIHLNPAEVFESGWKKGSVGNMRTLEARMSEYRFSSLPEYTGISRGTSAIVDPVAVELFLVGMPKLTTLLDEAHEYYQAAEFHR